VPHALTHVPRIRVATVIMLWLCAACETADPVAPVATPPIPSTPTSYVTVSSEAPVVGSVITVVGNADRAGGTPYGSFTAHLAYDRTRLEFVDEVALGGGMRAIHVTPGVVAVAGAAPGADGFADGRLFAVRFRVIAAKPYSALSLRMDELNGVDFTSQLGRLAPRASIAVDASLK